MDREDAHVGVLHGRHDLAGTGRGVPLREGHRQVVTLQQVGGQDRFLVAHLFDDQQVPEGERRDFVVLRFTSAQDRAAAAVGFDQHAPSLPGQAGDRPAFLP